MHWNISYTLNIIFELKLLFVFASLSNIAGSSIKHPHWSSEAYSPKVGEYIKYKTLYHKWKLIEMFFTYMNGVIDTTAPYVNIFICYGQQLKYLFLLHSTPFPQEMLNTQTSEL